VDPVIHEEGESHHLCAVLGRLLCHVKHVRLSLEMFCPTLFDVVMGQEATENEAERPKPTSSQLETIIFDATALNFRLCSSAAGLGPISDESRNNAKHGFLERAQTCIAANKFPLLTRSAFFDRLIGFGGSFDAICERDLIKNITKFNPLVDKGQLLDFKGRWAFSHMFRYQNSNGEEEEIYGTPSQFLLVVSGPVWTRSAQDSKFPPEFNFPKKALENSYRWCPSPSLCTKGAV
jgi:hypothetical protein